MEGAKALKGESRYRGNRGAAAVTGVGHHYFIFIEFHIDIFIYIL